MHHLICHFIHVSNVSTALSCLLGSHLISCGNPHVNQLYWGESGSSCFRTQTNAMLLTRQLYCFFSANSFSSRIASCPVFFFSCYSIRSCALENFLETFVLQESTSLVLNFLLPKLPLLICGFYVSLFFESELRQYQRLLSVMFSSGSHASQLPCSSDESSPSGCLAVGTIRALCKLEVLNFSSGEISTTLLITFTNILGPDHL